MDHRWVMVVKIGETGHYPSNLIDSGKRNSIKTDSERAHQGKAICIGVFIQIVDAIAMPHPWRNKTLLGFVRFKQINKSEER